MTDSSLLLYDTVPLVDWQKGIEGTQVFVLAESVINPLVRTLADKARKQSPSGDDESRLYWGEMGRVHASISPHLLALDDWKTFEETVAFQPSWGVILTLRDEAQKHKNPQFGLLNHLREWTFIEPPKERHDEGPMLLRLSDWDVLQVLLNASNEVELTSLFGPIATFAYWHKDQQDVQQVTLKARQKHTLPHRSPQRISTNQYAALRALAHRHQHKKYADHLKQHHSEVKSWSDEALSTFLLRTIDTANRLKFTTEKDVVRYLSLATVFGEQFIDTPWAKEQLKKPAVMGTQSRMDRLYQRAIEELDKEPEG
ncbi:DUF4123 domain-containing protein [Vibrio sp. S9_S30]|uniref:DUF4123 domain-containing protein n=1 Tax=Vibrio sp. S9_S30 TaxID=2720226 RepID=UPI001681BAE3|nr:DUF4123 domain-containing protein [Vibrio sp. S9_S30]MBD1556998.1 DUF4123 domain-containing protein [Vibrio sp. S9_S30]